MKFILMMNAPRTTGDWEIFNWKPEERQAHAEYYQRLNRELKNAGELVTVEALAAPPTARIVKAGTRGEPIVTDGPFAESKEFLAGYWIVDVESVERAHAIAARASAAPGPGGTPCYTAIEVRQVMQL